MQRWSCEVCHGPVRFDASCCARCGSLLGYVPDEMSIRNVSTIDGVGYTVDGRDGHWWRCLNASYGCNWMLPADAADVWCRSCRLTRGRPDDARSEAVAAWSTVEAAKRRLVHQLDTIGLSVDASTPQRSDGLKFDFVHLDDGGVTTGYHAGVVTLDLAEADERHRELRRRQLGESFRTVIGHLRHESGHHYFDLLVKRTDELDAFRTLFGDDTAEYTEALERHYAEPAPWDPACHITAYATAHPIEDWAETFAHYLHLRDAAETAASYGVIEMGAMTGDFERTVADWQRAIEIVNAVAESLGVSDVYPFVASGAVTSKLAFVHRQVTSNAGLRRAQDIS